METQKKVRIRVFGGAVAALILLGVSIPLSSIVVVDQDEYVIVQNEITKRIDTRVYETGIYWVGPISTAIRFPKNVQRLAFDTISGSDDSPITIDSPISAKLDAYFQYRLNSTAIMALYLNYMSYTSFKDALLFLIWAIVSESMVDITYEQLYFNRTVVNMAIFQGLKKGLNPLGITVIGFQITEVEFPTVIRNAFEALQTALINQKVALEEQKVAYIRAQTLIVNAWAQANVSLIEARTIAEQTLFQARAVTEQLNMTLTMDAYTLGLLMNATYVDDSGMSAKVFNNTVDLLTYLWIQALKKNPNIYLILGDSTPVLPIVLPSDP